MVDRTYPHPADIDAEQAPPCVPYAKFAFYAAENARLTNELDLRIRQLMDVSRHCGQLLTANEELRAELDAERNAHNATAAQLYAELAEARAELDAMRQAHSVVAAKMAAMSC